MGFARGHWLLGWLLCCSHRAAVVEAKTIGLADECQLSQSAYSCAATAGFEQLEADYPQYTFLQQAVDATTCASWLAANAPSLDIMFFPGFQYGDCILQEASKYNTTTWMIGLDTAGGGTKISNVVNVNFKDEEPAFAVGYLAGLLTKTNVTAVLGGAPVAAVWKLSNGFAAGVRHACPACKVEGMFVNTFGSEELGNSSAEYLVQEKGADVVFGAGGSTGSFGILRAAELGARVIGVDVDEYSTTFLGRPLDLRQRLVTSAVKRVDRATYISINRILQVENVGEAIEGASSNIFFMDYSNDAVGLADCHDACEFIGDATWLQVAAVERQLSIGTLSVPLIDGLYFPATPIDMAVNAFYPAVSVSGAPEGRVLHAMAAMPGFWKQHLVIFGGEGATGILSDLWMYEVDAARWVSGQHGMTVGSPPPALAGACMVPAYVDFPHLNGGVIIYGGRNASKVRSNAVFTFLDQPGILGFGAPADPSIRYTWASPANLGQPPRPTEGPSCVSLNSTCFLVFGGRSEFSEWDTLHMACDAFSGEVTWTELWGTGLEASPAPRQRAGTAVVKGSSVGIAAEQVLLVVGGSSGGVALADVWAFALPPAAAAWTSLPSLPRALASMPVVFSVSSDEGGGGGSSSSEFVVVQPAGDEAADGFSTLVLLPGAEVWDVQAVASSDGAAGVLTGTSLMAGARAAGRTWLFGGSREAAYPDELVASQFALEKACPPGQQASGTICTDCPPGAYSRGGKGAQCELCARGTYAESAGMELCLSCGSGQFVNSSGATACDLCRAGTQSDAAAPYQCRECPKGRFGADEGKGECDECEFGEFQDLEGQTSCSSCQGHALTTINLGATASSDCVCMRGFFRVQRQLLAGGSSSEDPCRECPKGMICDDAGGSEEALRLALERQAQNGSVAVTSATGLTAALLRSYPLLKEGYMSLAADPLGVFQCQQLAQCPGGLPGSCSRGHDPGEIACGACLPDFTWTSGGDCKECTTESSTPIVVGFLVGLFVGLTGLVIAMGTEVVVRPHSGILVLIMAGIMLTSVQALGLISGLQVQLREPIKSLAQTVSLFSLDLVGVGLGCMLPIASASSFIMKQLLPAICALFVLLVCTVRKLLRKGKGSSSVLAEATSVISSVMSVLFLALATAIVSPWVCYQHPGSSGWSMVSSPKTLCYEHGEHVVMLVASLVSFLVNVVPFLAFVGYGTLKYRSMLSSSDASRRHLAMFRWLFMRFKPQTHYFGSVYLARNLVLVFVPVIVRTDLIFQLVVLVSVFLLFMIVQLTLQPWRSRFPNLVDGCMSAFLILLIMCAALPDSTASWLLLGFIACFLAPLVVVFLIVHTVVTKLRARHRKEFQAFICHHKSGAGCFARLLKLSLSTRKLSLSGRTLNVFIDTDNLTNLDRLFEVVVTSVEHLVIVSSSEVCLRPWCVGEMVSAMHAKIPTMKVIMPGYEDPSAAIIHNYESLADLTVLYERDITLQSIQATLEWVATLPRIGMPWSVSSKVLHSLCTHLVHRKESSIEFEPDACPDEVETVIGLDWGNIEAASAAYVLEFMLRDHLRDKPTLPQVLSDGVSLPKQAKLILVLLSQGALQQQRFHHVLLAAHTFELAFIPVSIDPDFAFPTEQSISDLGSYSSLPSESSEVLVAVIRQMFKTICVIFQPSAYTSSDSTLRVKAEQIGQRMEQPGMWTETGLRGSQASRNEVLKLQKTSANSLPRLTMVGSNTGTSKQEEPSPSQVRHSDRSSSNDGSEDERLSFV